VDGEEVEEGDHRGGGGEGGEDDVPGGVVVLEVFGHAGGSWLVG
jgi:hypothetical protein